MIQTTNQIVTLPFRRIRSSAPALGPLALVGPVGRAGLVCCSWPKFMCPAGLPRNPLCIVHELMVKQARKKHLKNKRYER